MLRHLLSQAVMKALKQFQESWCMTCETLGLVRPFEWFWRNNLFLVCDRRNSAILYAGPMTNLKFQLTRLNECSPPIGKTIRTCFFFIVIGFSVSFRSQCRFYAFCYGDLRLTLACRPLVRNWKGLLLDHIQETSADDEPNELPMATYIKSSECYPFKIKRKPWVTNHNKLFDDAEALIMINF